MLLYVGNEYLYSIRFKTYYIALIIDNIIKFI